MCTLIQIPNTNSGTAVRMMSLHNLGTDYAMYRAKTLHPDPNAHGNIGKMPTGKLSDPRPYLRHLISRKRYTFCCVTIDPGSGHPRVSAGRSPLLASHSCRHPDHLQSSGLSKDADRQNITCGVQHRSQLGAAGTPSIAPFRV